MMSFADRRRRTPPPPVEMPTPPPPPPPKWGRRAAAADGHGLARRRRPSCGRRTVPPVATCRQSPYRHKPAVVIVTSFYGARSPHSHYDVTQLATPTITDVRTLRTDTSPRLIYRDIYVAARSHSRMVIIRVIAKLCSLMTSTALFSSFCL